MDYFVIDGLLNKVWEPLRNGKHLLIPGPRRIGKTQLLNYLLENPEQGFIPIYIITESADSVNEFYRKLLHKMIHEELAGRYKALFQKAVLAAKRINIEELGGKVKFGHAKEVNFEREFVRFLKSLELTETLLLMIDEFPQTIENITKNENQHEARRLLQLQREHRQDPELEGKIQFIYAGSIGLENVVDRMESIKHINDLHSVRIPALTEPQAEAFLDIKLSIAGTRLDDETKKTLFTKLEWLTPFYIESMVDELQGPVANKEAIDQAFDRVLHQRQHFAHWHARLKQSLPIDQYRFAKAVLSTASDPEDPGISSSEITNLAIHHQVDDHQSEIINTLKHDGYLNNQEDATRYRYNSPLVRMWWWRNVAN